MARTPRDARQFGERVGAALAQTGEWLDAAFTALAPVWGARRREARRLIELRDKQQQAYNRHFEAAENNRLRGDTWLRSRLSPDSALEQDLIDVREHAQELYRNFGFLQGAIEHRCDNVVGCGIRAQARVRPVPEWIGSDEIEAINARLEDVYERWAPKAGRGGRVALWDLQRQAQRNWRRDGEAFVVFSDVMRDGKPIPMELGVVAAERIETPPQYAGDPYVRLGIRYARRPGGQRGEVLGYYVRSTHPYDTLDNQPRYDWYPAGRVAHLYEQLFPDQSRGLPWCFGVTAEAKDYKDFREAVIIAAQIAACVTMVVGTTNPHDAAAGALNGDGEQDMEPGKILYRSNLDTVETLSPSQPTTTFGMFSEWNLLGMSAGLNYPFSWVVRDRRKASYSAGKLEEIDGSVPIGCDQQRHRDTWLVPVWHRLVDQAVIAGEVPIDPTDYAARPHVYRRHVWIGPGRPWIDPPKEVSAAVESVEHNMDTLTAVLARKGQDVDEVLETRSRERRRERDMEIVPPIKSGNGHVAGGERRAESGEPENSDETDEVPA